MTLQQLRYVVAVADSKSINKAAESLFITQPSLSNALKELENELGITIFSRNNRGIEITPDGDEFLGYARQMLEHYELIEERYADTGRRKRKFSVSMQHYSFAVEAFISLVKEFGMDGYEFAVHETKTSEVIENVKIQKSELGIIYLNDFNNKVISKILHEDELEFVPLFDCSIYVYLCKTNPLAGKKLISFEDLEDYPCLSFEQGDKNSFYYSEEVLSTLEYKKIIRADDRATFLNLMKGLNAYTLCSGIICQNLNGDDYTAIPFDTDEKMHIGYIKKKRMPLSRLGERYVYELRKYRNKVL